VTATQQRQRKIGQLDLAPSRRDAVAALLVPYAKRFAMFFNRGLFRGQERRNDIQFAYVRTYHIHEDEYNMRARPTQAKPSPAGP
jgi:hypothetical protein